MKILIIQEQGRHEKNRHFRESLVFQDAFTKLGIESIVWGLNYSNFTTSFEEISENCDIILCIENYDNGWLPNMKDFKGLKLFWSIDSHVIPQQHVLTCLNGNFQIVLNAIESHSKFFKKQKCYYLPNAYPDNLIYPKPEIKKIHDIGFCGNYVNRRDWIDSIPNIKNDIFVIGDDMVNAINSYKIHFNRNMKDDINYRTFETLGCNTLLLTNQTENLENLFEIGKHLDVYTSKEDLNEKINHYIKNEDIRNKISEEGYKHVKENHTYFNRVKQIIEIIKENV